MKHVYILLLTIAFTLTVSAQVKTQNYIEKRITIDKEVEFNSETQYYDGLGRPQQTLFKNIVSGKTIEKPLLTLQEYDDVGRLSNTWLPVASVNEYLSPSTFKSIAKGNQGYNDARPYTQNIYENSPLSRPLKQYGAGDEWKNNPVQTSYITNGYVEGADCSRYSVDSSGELVWANHYPGELYVTKNIDEVGNVGYTFINKLGQTILTRQIDGSEKLDTYYVYDDYGRLSYVLPPLLSDSLRITYTREYYNMLDKYAYQYKYNDRDQCTSKKMPGCEAVNYVFDKAGQLIFSRDGEQRNQKKWTFYLYDKIGRLVVQGECSNGNTVIITDQVITTDFVATNSGLGNSGYTCNFTLLSPVIHIVNYYDDYRFRSLTGFNNSNFPAGTVSAKGMLTGSVTTVLDSNTKLYSASYYDDRGRVVNLVSSNHMGGYDKTATTYTFTGKPKTVTSVHTASGKTTQTQVYTYNYDHAERLKTVTHKWNNGSVVTLVNNTYDSLGRLQKNSRNGTAALADNYAYNVRSWVTRISGTQFTEDLTYKYNGNIASMQWLTGGKTRKYTYTYDPLSRLKTAAYTGATTAEKYNTSYTYDKHGNIKTLERYGKTTASAYGIVDKLTMGYTGNQLTNVTDAGVTVTLAESNDFKKGSTANPGYAYNKNGAMTKDLNKKISNISYNSLNLPKSLVINGVTHSYTYAADGTKLRVVQGTTNRDYAGSVIYENGSLKRILVEGGYIEGGTYHFFLNDHLGNTRVVANASGTAVQRDHYYPFGLPMAETTNTEQNKQPYKYNGKEFDRTDGVNLYDYHARQYDAGVGRFTTMDPLAEKYYSVSPYAYCNNNPMRYIDPTGMHINVKRLENGTYEIIGGEANSNSSIYLIGADGESTRIGRSMTVASFFTESGDAVTGAIIDPTDQAGLSFIANIISGDLYVVDYGINATGGEILDFKTDGISSSLSDDAKLKHVNRGYSLGEVNGDMIFASARDIGNFAAGYVAGRNSAPWRASRLAFDALQSYQDGKLTTEGFPSQAAQRVGWELGIKNQPAEVDNAIKRFVGNVNSLINSIYTKIKK